MSGIEERLARDIAAVTEGVVMTESDLRDAREVLDGRIENGRQHDRRRTLLAAGAAAAVVVAVGVTLVQTLGDDDKTAPPANQPSNVVDPDADFLSGQSPSPELINGLWRVDNGQMLVLFDDGFVRFDDRGGLWSDPRTMGTYLIEGDTITVTTTLDEPVGCRLTAMSMRASVPVRGSMHVVHAGSADSRCSVMTAQERWVLEQVLPTSAALLGMDYFPAEFKPLTDPGLLSGDWVAQGGGYVLELASNASLEGGSYYVADESGHLVDQGEWALSPSSTDLRLVSSRDSATCAAGDRLVLSGLASVEVNPTAAFRGTVQQNDCGGGWTPDEWILLPRAQS